MSASDDISVAVANFKARHPEMTAAVAAATRKITVAQDVFNSYVFDQGDANKVAQQANWMGMPVVASPFVPAGQVQILLNQLSPTVQR